MRNFFVKKGKAEIPAQEKKLKEKKKKAHHTGDFADLLYWSIYQLFAYLCSHSWEPGLHNQLWGHVKRFLLHSSVELFPRLTFPTITRWCTKRKVLLGSVVKDSAKFTTWWVDAISLIIQWFWQEQMVMSFSNGWKHCKHSKAPEGWRSLGILPEQQLFCNSNGCPSIQHTEVIRTQLLCSWF